MKRRQRPTTPRYGDEIYIPSRHPDGHWTNGIVNSGINGMPRADGKLLVAAPGHRMSNTVLVDAAAYRTQWCWPEDVGQVERGAKPTPLDELQG